MLIVVAGDSILLLGSCGRIWSSSLAGRQHGTPVGGLVELEETSALESRLPDAG